MMADLVSVYDRIELQGSAVVSRFLELTGVRMTHTFVVDVTQQDAFAEADYPTVVTLINSKQTVVLTSPSSSPDTIQESRVSNATTPAPPSPTALNAHTITVRKNDKYYDQPLRTLGSLQPSDNSVSLCGVLVKVMDVRRCSSGDFSRMIFLIDETTATPFQITVFFKEEEQGSIFSCMGSPVFISTVRLSLYNNTLNGLVPSEYSAVCVYNPLSQEFATIKTYISEKSIQERCVQLCSWFAALSCEALAQMTRQLYSRPLAALAEGEEFDCFCKVVRVEPIRQDFVRCLVCFDQSMLYTARCAEDAVRTVTVQADLKCSALQTVDADALFVEFFHLSNLQNAILFTPKSSFLVVPPSCSISQRLQAAWRETCAKPPTLAPLAQPPADCTLQMVSLYEVRKEQQCVVRWEACWWCA
ncbi:hypothetical protein AV274_2102 [Blastocystis sp. ATCC 50177/Nand II]|uniref:Telomeric single stranded DNA binding POT1/Cdc13 domain-containing protein n=1 Tax=Blastocystis sp. subtype 1 (strain ATCC 50177 / NandII) TaxID=478820 RepID=A0A196SIM4_BLAHN|nr:hypothetical protein AV274_2102 [Blastocystis sp. ATCC 50177/Nand II]